MPILRGFAPPIPLLALAACWLVWGNLACKARATGELADVQAAAGSKTAASHLNPLFNKRVDKSYRPNERFEMGLDPSRSIDQITIQWDVSYSVPLMKSNGKPALNDEGAPKYKDGMYAQAKVGNTWETARQLDEQKFVDSGEIDNWHDLGNIRGQKLFIRFFQNASFENEPEVIDAKTRVRLSAISIRYADAPGVVFKDYIFNKDPDGALLKSARVVNPGETFDLKIPAELKVYRIDVRWGDAKPRVKGVYQVGEAAGRLRFNGAWQGPARNVAYLETQTWVPLDYPKPNGPEHTLSVAIADDVARIHSVRVYYEP